METSLGDLKTAAKRALQRETDVWNRLQAAPGVPGGEERQQLLDEWFKAREALRDAHEQLMAVAVHHSTGLLRECAEVLRAGNRLGGADATGAGRRPPAAGTSYRARADAVWDVLEVTHDVLEPELFLAQLRRRGDGRAEEVYSEDWPLFCVLNGLRGPA